VSRRRIHYAWIVLGVTFLALLAGAGIRATPSVLIVPWEEEFGWPRSIISFAISVNILLYGLMGPFAGALMQRLGIRRTTVGALCLLVVGVMLSTRVTEPWQLVLTWGVIVGSGSGMVALVLGATVVNRWFSARRGLAMGLLTASTATGQLVFLPLVGDYQPAFWTSGGLCLLAALLALQVGRRPARSVSAPSAEPAPAGGA
jgi:MFS family permease